MAVRAVRDHLADCLVTLPALLERGDPGPIHLYFANHSGMRKTLFPRLDTAYKRWLENAALEELRDLLPDALAHWRRMAAAMLAIFDGRRQDLDSAIDALVDEQARY
jgi:hypothetical protein